MVCPAPKPVATSRRAGVPHWAIRTRHAPKLRVPPEQHRTGTILTQLQRLAWLRRVIEGDRLDPLKQVVITLILLYAQPLARIVRLRTGDISHDHRGRTLLALGDPTIPNPSPFDAILATYLAERPNLTTATNRNSDWLFPGRRGAHPIHPTTMRLRLSRLGLDRHRLPRPGPARAGHRRPTSHRRRHDRIRQQHRRTHRQKGRRHLEPERRDPPDRPNTADRRHRPAAMTATSSPANQRLAQPNSRPPAPRAAQHGTVLAGVKAKPYGRPTAGLDTGCGRRHRQPSGSELASGAAVCQFGF